MLVADLKPRKSELMLSRETGDFFLASYLGPVALIQAELEMQLPIDQRGFACSAGDAGLIPGWGRSPEGGNGSPLQCSCLENPMDRGACWLQSMGSQRVGHDLATKQQRIDRRV